MATEEKKGSDKWKKKQKEFFDQTVKSKHRINTLNSLLGSATEEEQDEFCQEHLSIITEVLCEGYFYQVEKLKDNKSEHSINSKEIVEILRICDLFQKPIRYITDDLNKWDYPNIVNILKLMLCPDNHIKLRIEGFRMLLLILNAIGKETTELFSLYRQSIPESVMRVSKSAPQTTALKDFVFDHSLEMISQDFQVEDYDAIVISDDVYFESQALVQRDESMNVKPDSEQFLDLIYQNLLYLSKMEDKDGAVWTLDFMWQIYKKAHLSIDSNRSKIQDYKDSAEDQVYSPYVLKLHISFINSACKNALKEQKDVIFKTLLSTPSDKFLTLKIIEQAITLYDQPDVIKNAVFIMNSWVQLKEDVSPLRHFLNFENSEKSSIEENHAIKFLIQLPAMSSSPPHKLFNHESSLIESAIAFYLNFFVKYEKKCHSSLKTTIQKCFLALHTRLRVLRPMMGLVEAENLFKYFYRSLFAIWTACMPEEDKSWNKLSNLCELPSIQMIDAWDETMRSMCEVYSRFVFGIDLLVEEVSEGVYVKKIKNIATLKTGNSFNFTKLVQEDQQVSTEALTGLVCVPGQSVASKDMVKALLSDLKTYQWNPDLATQSWFHLLCIFGNINKIRDYEVHLKAMNTLSFIIQYLKLIQKNQSLDHSVVPNLKPIMNWVFEACQLSSQFDKSVNIAYSIVCRSFCDRTQCDLRKEDLNLFYGLLLKGFESNNAAIGYTILRNSASLFAIGLPGVHVLIEPFVRFIRNKAFNQPNIVEQVYESIPPISYSIVELCKSFSPSEKKYLQKTITDLEVIPQQIMDVLLWLGSLEGSEISIPSTILHAITSTLSVLAFRELTFQQGNKALADDCVNIILNQLRSSHLEVVYAAIGAIDLFAQNIDKLPYFDDTIKIAILQKMVGSASDVLLNHELEGYEAVKEEIMVLLLLGIQNWMMTMNQKSLAKGNVLQLVFELIESALDEHQMLDSASDATPSEAQSYAGSTKQLNLLSETAHHVLLFLYHHFNHFPPIEGKDLMINTAIVDDLVGGKEGVNEDHFQFFIVNDTTLIAITDKTDDSNSCRLVIRDLCGRCSWDCKMLQPPEQSSKVLQMNGDLTKRKVSDASTDQKETSSSKEEVILKSTRGMSAEQEDAFSNFLGVLGMEHPELLLFENHPLNVNQPLSQTDAVIVDNFMAKMSQVTNFQKIPPVNYTKLSSLQPTLPLIDGHQKYPFQISRMLWNALGQGNFDALKHESVYLLKKSSALYRDIKGLDKKHGRELFKAAILFVGPNQEDETSILSNKNGSTAYHHFVQSLGWQIDLSSHDGFLGGLDKQGSNGQATVYYCNAALELVFHEVVGMPNDEQDPKQLKKKRHIGNDDVHVVWNEHFREYHPRTISGDFGNAQIIVTPLPSGLYHISIFKSHKIRPFGPLQHNMMIPHHLLGPLVRATVLDANRACKEPLVSASESTASDLKMNKHPFSQRAQDIRIICQRHKIETWTFEKFLNMVLVIEENLDLED